MDKVKTPRLTVEQMIAQVQIQNDMAREFTERTRNIRDYEEEHAIRKELRGRGWNGEYGDWILKPDSLLVRTLRALDAAGFVVYRFERSLKIWVGLGEKIKGLKQWEVVKLINDIPVELAGIRFAHNSYWLQLKRETNSPATPIGDNSRNTWVFTIR